MQTYSPNQKGPLKISGFVDPDDTTIVSVFWGAQTVVPNAVYRLDDVVRPSVDNGYYYICTTNGVSGSVEPTWNQGDTTSGTAVFTATPWDLWLLPNQSITLSTWSASANVNIQSSGSSGAKTATNIGPFDSSITQFELTNQVTKSNGESLSRSFLYKTNQQ